MRSPADQWSVAEFQAARRAFSGKVESIALRALSKHGYYGINPLAVGPNSLDELKAATSQGSRLFPVYAGHSDRTIYNSPRINLLMRAWHDLVHLELDAPFTYEGELAVGRAQLQHPSIDGADSILLHADIIGQIEFYAAIGTFPDDQRGFVLDYINHGPTHAISAHGGMQWAA